jgi:ABC-type transport system involved in multi-copper enzyme maturation permease subunit
MRSLFRIGQVALAECAGAVRSRRALVILVLYLLSAVFCMMGTITMLGKMEAELAKVLQLPESERTGVVSVTLWKSKPFQRMIKAGVKNDLVYNDIAGRHPAELVYAWFAFMCAPLLAVLVAGNRVADDLKSGAVRYAIVRVTRLEWTLGKYVGQILMVAIALAASAIGAWLVAVFRLSGIGTFELLPAMFVWGARAGLYALAWIGLALGVSHVTRSGSRATALGLVAVALCAAWPNILEYFAGKLDWPWLCHFDALVPSSAEMSLWRSSFVPLFTGGAHLLALGLAYLMLGHAVFARRDA